MWLHNLDHDQTNDMMWSMKTLYHVTHTYNLENILERGLLSMQTSNWVNHYGERYGNGEIYAFDHKTDAIRWASRMDWEFNQALGTGKITIIQFTDNGKWQQDKSDPISQSTNKGKWWKKTGSVKPKNIISTEQLTQSMTKTII